MEGLIFSLPILIIFFFILFQIFSIVKRVINTLLKKFQLTIDQAGEEGKRSDSLDDLDYNQYDEEEVEKRINEAEKKSLAKRKEEILNRGNNSNKKIEKADERQINELKKPNKSNSFAKTF